MDHTGVDVLDAMATWSAALLAVGALLGVLSRLRPVQWLWRQVVAEPVGEWFGEVVDRRLDPIREQFGNNGGTTARDALDRIEASVVAVEDRLAAEVAERLARQDLLDARLAEGDARMGRIEALLHGLTGGDDD